MERVTWRGTPGVGDFMWALNSVHKYCFDNNTKVKLEMYWEHGPDHLHHFEDPETIIERMDYIHNFYHRKDDVTVEHIFYGQDYGYYSDWHWNDDVVLKGDQRHVEHPKQLGRENHEQKNRFWFESGAYDDKEGAMPDNTWVFRRDAFQETDRHKFVFWTPRANAEVPRYWKRKLTSQDWDDIINMFRRAGMNVIEIDYRTPIREAMYHISTCRQVICYDGMWHYIAKNFVKPLAVISKEGVTKYHTPHALRVCPDDMEDTNIWYWMRHLNDFVGRSKRKAIEYEKRMEPIWEK
jgi:hypothetical protein